MWFLFGGGLMKSIVTTGVSTGIGNGAAKEFVRGGYRVFGSVRKREDVERLATEFGPGFVPLVFDVTDQEAVRAAAEEVGRRLVDRRFPVSSTTRGLRSGVRSRCSRSGRSGRTSRSTWWA